MTPDEHAKQFLEEHLDGPETYLKYEAQCKEQGIQPVEFLVFSLYFFQHIGAIKS